MNQQFASVNEIASNFGVRHQSFQVSLFIRYLLFYFTNGAGRVCGQRDVIPHDADMG